MSSFLTATNHRIIGIGNAGVNFLDRLLVASPSFSGLIAINNDAESLAASVVANQIAWTSDLETSADLTKVAPRLAEEIDQASVVILVGGLGGGFASALLPQVAAMCKAAKKLTIACVSLPFSFEGKRAQSIAMESLTSLENSCDGTILLENDRLCSRNASTAAFGETFAASDQAMEACLPALLTILFNKGPVRITRPNLMKALHRHGAKTCFGYGQAIGPNRLHQAVERALKNPLLDRGRCFAKASDIFLLLRGPKDISFAEAQAAMHEIERLATGEHDIQLSVHAQEPEGAPLQIFLLATVGGNPITLAKVEPEIKVETQIKREPTVLKKEVPVKARSADAETPKPSKIAVPSVLDSRGEEEVKELFPEATYEVPVEPTNATAAKASTSSKIKQTQGAFDLKAIQRGRFDKSEPTIVEGEDLDTPTYLRLGLKLS